jgi:chorismate mutase
VSGQADDPVVRDLRARIDASDRAVLAAVNARLELVEALWRHKDAQGYAHVDPERESALLDRLVRENPGPISEEGLREVFGALVSVTKREVATTLPRSPRA